MTTKESAQILAVLTAAYPNAYKNMTEKEAAAVALVWAAQFSTVPYDVVFMALQKSISTCKYPPTVCEVKEKIGTIHWEAYEELRKQQAGYSELTAEEEADYRRICDSTEQFRNFNSGPELRDMLPHSRRMLTAADNRKIQ